MRTTRRTMVGLGVIAALAFSAAACSPPAAPAPRASAASCGLDGLSSAVIDAVNSDRAANGLPGLEANGQLTCLAQSWSGQMAGAASMYHQNIGAVLNSPDYRSYNTLGENILRGPDNLDAGAMNTAWMNSPEHRANILSGSYRWIGVGVTYSNGEMYAAQEFGG